MPRADLFPEIDFTIREVPTKVNPVGAKGVGRLAASARWSAPTMRSATPWRPSAC